MPTGCVKTLGEREGHGAQNGRREAPVASERFESPDRVGALGSASPRHGERDRQINIGRRIAEGFFENANGLVHPASGSEQVALRGDKSVVLRATSDLGFEHSQSLFQLSIAQEHSGESEDHSDVSGGMAKRFAQGADGLIRLIKGGTAPPEREQHVGIVGLVSAQPKEDSGRFGEVARRSEAVGLPREPDELTGRQRAASW